MDKLDKNAKVFASAKRDSWDWFFDTIYHLNKPLERLDGKSLGNFWAIVQHLEQQVRDSASGNAPPCGVIDCPVAQLGECYCPEKLEEIKKANDGE